MFTSKVVMQLLSKRKYQNRDIIYRRNTRNSTPRESSRGKRPDQRPTSGKSRRSNSWESRSRSPTGERRLDRPSSGRSRSPTGERRQDRPSSGRSRNSNEERNRQGPTSGKSRNSNEERNQQRSTPSRRRSSTPLKARDLVTMRSTFLDKRKSTRTNR